MFKLKTEYEKKAWSLVVYCWLAYTTVYIGRKNLSVCLTDMIADGVIDSVSGGTVGTCFLLCYAVGQFINGRLGDRFHPRHMICIGLFLAGVMNLLMGLNSTAIFFMLIWGANGFACSMMWSPIVRAISTWTNDEISHAAATSLTANIPVGTVLSYLICSFGLRFFNWRIAFIFCGSVLVVMAVILTFCFRRLKEHTTLENTHPAVPKNDHHDSSNAHTKVTIFCAGLVFCAVSILFNGMLKDGLDLWIPTVLENKFIPSSYVVSLICTILPVLNIFGAFAAQIVYEHFHIDELTTCGVMFAVSTAALAIVTVFIRITPTKTAESVIVAGDVFLAILVTLLLAVSSAAMLGANNMLLTFIPLHFGKVGRASTVTGMLNCFSYAAAAVSSVAVGSVSETFGWEAVFALFIGASLFGGVVCLMGHKKLHEKTDELDRCEE